MTATEHPDYYSEAVGDFLKLHKQELELQAVKLARFYSIDLYELLSRTSISIWDKWSSKLCMLPDNENYRYTLRILSNHARNLSKTARHDWNKCTPFPRDDLADSACTLTTWRDPATEAIFKDERLAIYTAISRLDGRCKDVMVLVALGLENSEIRQELGMTVTNLTSTLARARKLLREILGLADEHEDGELR